LNYFNLFKRTNDGEVALFKCPMCRCDIDSVSGLLECDLKKTTDGTGQGPIGRTPVPYTDNDSNHINVTMSNVNAYHGLSNQSNNSPPPTPSLSPSR
jgi:hypothetical protein